MIWDSRTVYTLWKFKPVTEMAIKWLRVSNGNWKGLDRSLSEDVFKTNILFRGPRSELLDLEDVLNDNRYNFNITCGIGEEIFGADIDYSSPLSVTVINYGSSKRVGFDSYSMNLGLRLNSPVFVSDSPSISTLRQSNFSSLQHSDFSIKKHFTYEGNQFYSDSESDPGIFEATFTQTPSEMRAIRRYLTSTARANTVVFPTLANVSTPFGSRLGTGPFNCKIIGWEDQGRENLIDWKIKIKFALER